MFLLSAIVPYQIIWDSNTVAKVPLLFYNFKVWNVPDDIKTRPILDVESRCQMAQLDQMTKTVLMIQLSQMTQLAQVSKPVQIMQLFEINQLPQMTPTGWNDQLPQTA